MLRSIFQADKKCAGRRNLSALLSAKLEMKFLGLAAEYFESGWKLGSPDGPSIANAANNYLTRGVVEYFSATGRPEIAIGFLKQQLPNHPSLSGLLFGCLIKAGTMAGLGICKLANLIFYITSHRITSHLLPTEQQGLAIQLATEGKVDSSCYGPLADFLISRNAFRDAQLFAQEALKREPLVFKSWTRLAAVMIGLGKHSEVIQWDGETVVKACPF